MIENVDEFLQMIQDLERTRDELEEMQDSANCLAWENRRWLKHPYNEGRAHGAGFYHNNFQDLKNYPEKFKMLTRMTPDAFRYLLCLAKSHIKPKHNTPDAVPAKQRLTITLV